MRAGEDGDETQMNQKIKDWIDVLTNLAIAVIIFLALYVWYPAECRAVLFPNGQRLCPCVNTAGVSPYGWANTTQIDMDLNVTRNLTTNYSF